MLARSFASDVIEMATGSASAELIFRPLTTRKGIVKNVNREVPLRAKSYGNIRETGSVCEAVPLFVSVYPPRDIL
jgi:hypothetical protein